MNNNGDTDKLDWMYKGANSHIDQEEYLLGKSVDKSFEQINREEKEKKLGVVPPKNHVEHECIPPSIRDFNKIVHEEQVDLSAKLQEDPLMAIKKQEEEARRQFLQNPIQLKKLQDALKVQEEKKKKKKKKRRNDSDSEDDLDKQIAEKLKHLKGNFSDLPKKKKKSKTKHLDTILMHKFNQLKDKLSQEDMDDILAGKSSGSDEEVPKKKTKHKSSNSEEDSDDQEKISKAKTYRGKQDDVKDKQSRYKRNSRSESRSRSNKTYEKYKGHRKSTSRDRSKDRGRDRKDSSSDSEHERRNKASRYEKQRDNRYKRSRDRSRERTKRRRSSSSEDRHERSRKTQIYNKQSSKHQLASRNRSKERERRRRDSSSDSESGKRYKNNKQRDHRKASSRDRSTAKEKSRGKSRSESEDESNSKIYRYEKKKDLRSVSREKSSEKKRNNGRSNKKPNEEPESNSNSSKEASVDNDLDKMILEKLQMLRESAFDNKEEFEDTQQTYSHYDSDNDEYVYKKKSFGLVKSDGTKIPLKNPPNDNKKLLPKKIDAPKLPDAKNKPNKRLTDKEKEELRRQMMVDAVHRDKERSDNLKKHRHDNQKEESKIETFDKNFVHRELYKGQSDLKDVESRLKTKLNNIQRSSQHMNSNFSKRS
ncbi:unnamed protein product [Diabrotica balteata]|uniref:Uncharacterized protein n=1 Tax=Diabrotica balteata TaxID=107213 RepID=A0A9N9XGE2_DIABA|nr:unnamed protein product [Diabrotica balteata]